MTELKRYEEDDKRYYDTPIGKLPSATTILKALAKPALVGWSAKMTAEYMRGILANIATGNIIPDSLTDKEIDRLVKEAKSQYRQAGKEAMDIGSAVHAWIEIRYKMMLSKQFEDLPALTPEIEQAIIAFREWDSAHKVRPICVEERIWSTERFAGTLDLYAEVGGALSIVDFKSSKGHYSSEHAMQLGAYDLAFRERTGNRVDKYFIVRLDKETGLVDPMEYSREEVGLGARRFLFLCKYFWLTENGKKTIDKSV